MSARRSAFVPETGARSGSARIRCEVCPRGCELTPGGIGSCRARGNVGGTIMPMGYGRVTSLAIDPIEKKPLACWRPGTKVLSLGSFGCNLHCAWCQNHIISQAGEDGVPWREASPEAIVALAVRAHEEDELMTSVAYTYNEPLVGWEYVRDTSVLVHEAGLANVLVTAGCVRESVVREVAPLIDAVNIDLKSIRHETYSAVGGDLDAVQSAIRLFAAEPNCHVEVTTLVVPGINDTREEMDELAAWIASVDKNIVLHVTRFFPAWRMRKRTPTPVSMVYDLADVARAHLSNVFTGNC
ncbi:MAG: AmmeMemoRadiSam system radical SAM enzyme [Atopobiaceae bacterium]|nr:AmmeMemoRadiSam system radical SAM enzyme [Atopobiaceae bacterium]